ncbi:hypothetical protein AB0L75_16215 [Streptomyces sp. NPDC052101]|uniref:hypothetical protein n=1 Tax=Streptomyces sp. NPDC052101 TaxID=3155763 RepID=UPI003439D9A3
MYATVDEVAARLTKPVLPEERPRIEALIGDASAYVADYCTGAWDRSKPPAIFKTVVCSEVMRWLAVQPGIVSERVGDVEVQFGPASAAQQLSPAAKASLRRYRRSLTSIRLEREKG